MTSVTDQHIEARIEALLARMTLDQKVGQMTQPERLAVTPEDVRAYHLGSILSGGGSRPGNNTTAEWVAMNDAYWAASMAEGDDRVPIPLIYGVDAIHGHNNVSGSTIFPHNIGLGAANDPDLLQRIAEVTAREVLATGVEWTFAPTLAVARNPRWGRTYESYAERPDIIASYADRFVHGLQGDLGRDGVVACVKHWIGDGGTTEGIDQGETTIPEEELRRIHMAPYLPALQAGVLTVMVSYNSWNGEKCHGHRYLITDVLKGELGFRGFVISDWDGIDQIAEDYVEAVTRSVNAGIDMFMVPAKWKEFLGILKSQVERGEVSMDRIDDAVRRILRVKFEYGLFERPRPAERFWSDSDSFGSADHRAVAREAVRKSLVLLKNDTEVLPLRRNSRILVTGKNADDRGHQCGGFTVEWQGTSGNEAIAGGSSIWEGIRNVAPGAVLSHDVSEVDPAEFDVAVVVIGERPYSEGMGDLRSGGAVAPGSQLADDRANLQPYSDTLEHCVTHPEDLAVIRQVSSLGIPVVTVLVSGRPLVVNSELEESAAFVAAWLPGSEGQGVADVLFGDHDFRGRLSFSWPRHAAQVPVTSDEDDPPLHPYGYGLTMSGTFS